jgi:hypothetical protein
MRVVFVALLGLASLGVAGPGATTENRPSALGQITERASLGGVLRQIGERWPGRALTARTIERDGRSLYQIKWLGTDGKVRDILCDARTGQILHVH